MTAESPDESVAPQTAGSTPLGWSLWITGLGAEPLRALAHLGRDPLFADRDRRAVLAVRDALPHLFVDALAEGEALAHRDRLEALGVNVEVRTYARGRGHPLEGVDVDALFDGGIDGVDDHTEAAPSDQLIAAIEAELGFRLPDALIALARHRNGGYLAQGAYPMSEPTGWADDHIAVTGLYALGRTATWSIVGELGSTFMRDEWGYPAWGVGIADTPTGGHEQIMLDYRACGPSGEPRVVYVDQEDDYRVIDVAPDVATFLAGLVDPEVFDDSDPAAERAAALDTVAHGTLSPIVTRALALSPDLAPVAEPALRELGRRVVDRHGFFSVRADDDSRAMLDLLFLLHTRVARVASVDELMDPPGDTSYDNPSLPLMVFFAIVTEPYSFRTGGYAPGFVTGWWDERVAHGRLHETPHGWRFTTDAEATVIARARELAAGA